MSVKYYQGKLGDIAGSLTNKNKLTDLYERQKQQALGEIDKGFTEGAREGAAVSGAGGFAGGGGRTQDVISDLSEKAMEQRGATSLGYDQALSDALFGRQQAAAGIYSNLAQTEEQKQARQAQEPQWYDYLLGGLSGAAQVGGSLFGA